MAMEELGYQPNAVARSLRRKKTHTIGMIVPDSTNPFFAEVARGIEDTSFEHGYSVILCNSDGDLSKELLYTNVLVERQADGILFLAAGDASIEHVLGLQARRIPLVVMDRDISGAAVDTVLTDNAQGGWQATHHLVYLGHQRIGCITGPSNLTPSADRFAGYQGALRESNIALDETLVIQGDFQYEGGYQAAQKLLALTNPPTAIFACNDLMAIGAISAAIELGLQVPRDLSVIGFDDIRLASFTNPPLTTVVQPKYEMGVLATRLLFERMDKRDLPPRRQLLETALVIRRSTAAPKARGSFRRGADA